MIYSYGTDIGLVRGSNQDSVAVHIFSEDTGLFIVADGMGGHRGGKMASSIAVDTILQFFVSGFSEDLNSEKIKELLCNSIKEANSRVFKQSLDNPELDGMGTTVVAFLVKQNTLYTASVGDSRAYVCKDTRIFQITEDHSLVADLLRRGVIKSEEAKTHPQKNVITRAVGTESLVAVDIFETNLDGGSVVVACTDGLHGLLSDEEIAGVVSVNTEDSAQMLISMANDKGGYDNITVVAVKIS